MASKKKTEDHLKGSFFAVMGIGIFIILVWVYCFSLFTDRF